MGEAGAEVSREAGAETEADRSALAVDDADVDRAEGGREVVNALSGAAVGEEQQAAFAEAPRARVAEEVEGAAQGRAAAGEGEARRSGGLLPTFGGDGWSALVAPQIGAGMAGLTLIATH